MSRTRRASISEQTIDWLHLLEVKCNVLVHTCWPDGGGNQRPNQVPGVSPYLDHKSVDGWLNPKAFAPPPPATMGNVPRNSVRAPGVIQLDLSMARTFPIMEGKSVQLRAE